MQEFQQRARLPLAPGVALRWRIAPHLPEIATDAAKLTAVLDNLLNNAIKFTTAGSIVVSVTDCPDRGEVAFRVEDTGPGIPEAELLSIFEPFRQLDGRDDRRHGGVGLGLAIVRKYATLLAGEVSVRSALRAGTTFTLTLPYRPGAILDAGRRATRAA